MCQLCAFSPFFAFFGKKILMFIFFKVVYRKNKGAPVKVCVNERRDRNENSFGIP